MIYQVTKPDNNQIRLKYQFSNISTLTSNLDGRKLLSVKDKYYSSSINLI